MTDLIKGKCRRTVDGQKKGKAMINAKSKCLWKNDDGSNKGDEELRGLSQSWSAKTWESYLAEEVEEKLQETLFSEDELSIEISEDSVKELWDRYKPPKSFEGLKRLLLQIIEHLSEREKEVLFNFYWREKSISEISRELMIQRGSAYRFLDRAHSKLKRILLEEQSKRLSDSARPDVKSA